MNATEPHKHFPLAVMVAWVMSNAYHILQRRLAPPQSRRPICICIRKLRKDHSLERNIPMNADNDDVTVRIERRINASVESVFDAWLKPEVARKWLFATPTGKMIEVEIDPRLGGLFRIVEKRADGEMEHFGRYIEVDRPRVLSFTLQVGKASFNEPAEKQVTLATVELKSVDNACDLTLTHDRVLAEHRERTQQGWEKTLDQLVRVLKAESQAPKRASSEKRA